MNNAGPAGPASSFAAWQGATGLPPQRGVTRKEHLIRPAEHRESVLSGPQWFTHVDEDRFHQGTRVFILEEERVNS